MNIKRELGGRIERHFGYNGLRVEIDIPLSRLKTAGREEPGADHRAPGSGSTFDYPISGSVRCRSGRGCCDTRNSRCAGCAPAGRSRAHGRADDRAPAAANDGAGDRANAGAVTTSRSVVVQPEIATTAARAKMTFFM